MNRCGILVGAALLLVGCGPAFESVAALNAEPDDALCAGYQQAAYFNARGRMSLIRQEISRRGLVPAREWPVIAHGHIEIGMSRCGMLAAWGLPDRVNHVATRFAQTDQYVFGPNLVYIENGVVDGIQQF